MWAQPCSLIIYGSAHFIPSVSGVGGDVFRLGWGGLRWLRQSYEVTGMPGAPEVQPSAFVLPERLRARLCFGGKLEFLLAGVSQRDGGSC